MRSLAQVCRQAGMTIADLSEKINVPKRTLFHYFSNGLIPFVLVNKIARALSLPISEVVSEGLVADWEATYDQVKADAKPRGRREGWVLPKAIATTPPPKRENKKRVPTPPVDENGMSGKNVGRDPDHHELPPSTNGRADEIGLTKGVDETKPVFEIPEEGIDPDALAALNQEDGSEGAVTPPQNIDIPDDFFKTSMA